MEGIAVPQIPKSSDPVADCFSLVEKAFIKSWTSHELDTQWMDVLSHELLEKKLVPTDQQLKTIKEIQKILIRIIPSLMMNIQFIFQTDVTNSVRWSTYCSTFKNNTLLRIYYLLHKLNHKYGSVTYVIVFDN